MRILPLINIALLFSFLLFWGCDRATNDNSKEYLAESDVIKLTESKSLVYVRDYFPDDPGSSLYSFLLLVDKDNVGKVTMHVIPNEFIKGDRVMLAVSKDKKDIVLISSSSSSAIVLKILEARFSFVENFSFKDDKFDILIDSRAL